MTELRKALEAAKYALHRCSDLYLVGKALKEVDAALASQSPLPTDDVRARALEEAAALADRIENDATCPVISIGDSIRALSAQLPPPADGPFRVHTTDGGRVIVGEAGPLGLQFLCEICADQTHHMLAKADRIAAALNAKAQPPPPIRGEVLEKALQENERRRQALYPDDLTPDLLCVVYSYWDAHEEAVRQGFVSLTDALEALDEALATPSSPEGWVRKEPRCPQCQGPTMFSAVGGRDALCSFQCIKDATSSSPKENKS